MDIILNDAISEPEWMEKITPYWGLRVWHLGFFVISGFLSIGAIVAKLFNFSKLLTILFLCKVVMLCCCFRFRIPRTKQDIEADYQRRRIARKFRERLANIKNNEMDDMNLQKGKRTVHPCYSSLLAHKSIMIFVQCYSFRASA